MTILDVSGSMAGMALTIFLLGVKHGFDADHLAAIDSLARPADRAPPALTRNAGILFSLGHGTVVTAAAVAVATSAHAWQVPPWLATGGAWLAIIALILLAISNLASLRTAQGGHVVHAAGWRSSLLRRLYQGRGSSAAFGVGALFALSFDTLTYAALFGMTATRFGGGVLVVALPTLFVMGMLITDGLNGLWIAKIMQRSAHSASIASRVMVLAVAGISLMTAMCGIASQILPATHPVNADKGVWCSVAIVAIILICYRLASGLAKSPVVAHRATQSTSSDYQTHHG